MFLQQPLKLLENKKRKLNYFSTYAYFGADEGT
jgi:hypothetical protein